MLYVAAGENKGAPSASPHSDASPQRGFFSTRVRVCARDGEDVIGQNGAATT